MCIILIILCVFQAHLSHTLPMQLSMFTGSVVMAATYPNGILLPAALFLIAMHVVAFGLKSLVKVIQARTSPLSTLGANLLGVFNIYLEIFSINLMCYFFNLSAANILLSMTSFSCLAVVICELVIGFKSMHVAPHN